MLNRSLNHSTLKGLRRATEQPRFSSHGNDDLRCKGGWLGEFVPEVEEPQSLTHISRAVASQFQKRAICGREKRLEGERNRSRVRREREERATREIWFTERERAGEHRGADEPLTPALPLPDARTRGKITF